MALTFNSREAQDLISKHEQILKRLRAISVVPNQLQREAMNTIEKLQEQKFFSNMVERSVQFQDEVDDKSPGTEMLISVLYRYQKLIPASDSCNQLISFNADNIEEEIATLRKGGTGIRRLFSSSKKKESAEQAYEALQNRLSSSYYYLAQALFDSAEKIDDTPSSDQWSDFVSDKGRYRHLLHSVLPDGYTQKDAVPFFSSLLQKQEYPHLRQMNHH